MSVVDLLCLPYEIKRRMASFLSSKDAISMSLTCKTSHSSMLLGCLDPIPLFEHMMVEGDHDRGDDICQSVCIPVPVSHSRVHSITLSLDWMDQGWGNRKGKVYIVASIPDQRPDVTAPFHGGRLVYESELAPHSLESLKISFPQSEGERYHLWYQVGAHGGHLLYLGGGTVKVVIFDDSERNFTHIHRVLSAARVLDFSHGHDVNQQVAEFYPILLLSLCQFMRRNVVNDGNVEDNELIRFFTTYNISITTASTTAIEELIQENLKETSRAQQDCIYRKINRHPNAVTFNNNSHFNLIGIHGPQQRWVRNQRDEEDDDEEEEDSEEEEEEENIEEDEDGDNEEEEDGDNEEEEDGDDNDSNEFDDEKSIE